MRFVSCSDQLFAIANYTPYTYPETQMHKNHELSLQACVHFRLQNVKANDTL